MIDCDVVIYGGGHAGALVAKALEGQCKVALVDPNDFFEVCSSIVRSLVEPGFAEDATIPFKDALPKTQIVHGHLTELTADGEGKVEQVNDQGVVTIKAKVVVLATGSRYATTATRSNGDAFKNKRLEFYEKFAKRIEDSKDIVVAGGGPIGVEFAAEVVYKYKDAKKVTIINSSDRLLPSTSPHASKVATDFLVKNGVSILNNTKFTIDSSKSMFESGDGKLSDGQSMHYDVVLQAHGGNPISEYMRPHWSNVLNDRHEIKVTPDLCVEGNNTNVAIFAVGDVAALNEPKLAWLVGSQLPVVINNARSALEGKDKSKFQKYSSHPNDPRMAVTLGKEQGVMQLPYIGTVSWGWFLRKAKSQTMMVPKFRNELGV